MTLGSQSLEATRDGLVEYYFGAFIEATRRARVLILKLEGEINGGKRQLRDLEVERRRERKVVEKLEREVKESAARELEEKNKGVAENAERELWVETLERELKGRVVGES